MRTRYQILVNMAGVMLLVGSSVAGLLQYWGKPFVGLAVIPYFILLCVAGVAGFYFVLEFMKTFRVSR
jgi:hypothetical protein